MGFEENHPSNDTDRAATNALSWFLSMFPKPHVEDFVRCTSVALAKLHHQDDVFMIVWEINAGLDPACPIALTTAHMAFKHSGWNALVAEDSADALQQFLIHATTELVVKVAEYIADTGLPGGPPITFPCISLGFFRDMSTEPNGGAHDWTQDVLRQMSQDPQPSRHQAAVGPAPSMN